GYLPEVIQNHFGDGSRWGVEIDYSVSDADTLTSRRIQLALHLIDPCFLLMYCDNYWPMQMDRMWSKFVAADVPAMITVYSNKDKFSKDSVVVGDDGYVKVFDRHRKTPGLSGIEISYAILSREVLDLLPEDEMLVEEALYTPLARQGRLAAYVTDHRYYSVGSVDRLPITDEFFARRPTVILVRDGVINKKPPRAQYVRNWSEFEWLPGAQEALRMLREAGFRVILVSNQAGIARGAMSEADLSDIHQRLNAEVAEVGGRIVAGRAGVEAPLRIELRRGLPVDRPRLGERGAHRGLEGRGDPALLADRLAVVVGVEGHRPRGAGRLQLAEHRGWGPRLGIDQLGREAAL